VIGQLHGRTRASGHLPGVVYGLWIGVMVALYPLRLWFSRVKERRRDGWVSCC
jgi:hypothetical protein